MRTWKRRRKQRQKREPRPQGTDIFDNENKLEMEPNNESPPNPTYVFSPDMNDPATRRWVRAGISTKPPYRRFLSLHDRTILMVQRPFFFHETMMTWDAGITDIPEDFATPAKNHMLFAVAHGLLTLALHMWSRFKKMPEKLTCADMNYIIEHGDINSFMFMHNIKYVEYEQHFKCIDCIRRLPVHGVTHYRLIADFYLKWRRRSPEPVFDFGDMQFSSIIEEVLARRDYTFLNTFLGKETHVVSRIHEQLFRTFIAHMKNIDEKDRDGFASAFIYGLSDGVVRRYWFSARDWCQTVRMDYLKQLITWGCAEAVEGLLECIGDITPSKRIELLRFAALNDPTGRTVRMFISLGAVPTMKLLQDVIKVNEHAIPPIMEALAQPQAGPSRHRITDHGMSKLIARCRRDAPRSLVHSVLRVRPRAITSMLAWNSWNARQAARTTSQYVHEYVREAMPGWVFLQIMNFLLRNGKLESASPIMSSEVLRIIGYYMFKITFPELPRDAMIVDNDSNDEDEGEGD